MANDSDPMVVVPEHSLIAHKLTRLRDVNSSSMLFRNLASEITQVLVAEATRDLLTVEDVRNTPLESFSGKSLTHHPRQQIC